MHSSTSSSEIKVLRADWLRTWATTLVLTLLLLAGWEAFWRARGFKPTINDDAGLWAAARRRVGPDSIVLVGTSLMHAGVHPSVFEEVTGTTPVQLSVNGGRPYLLLENLARDQTFRGTVICELIEGEIIDEVTTSAEKSFISYYQQERLAKRSESFLQRFLQERLAFTSPQLSLPALIVDIRHARLPVPVYAHFHIGEARTLYVDFMKADTEKLRARLVAAPYSQLPNISPGEFVARARRFEVLAEEIERRGGRVIFVRLPFSGVAWERTEKAYPKASYWDEFARHTHFPTIHFKDYPELQVECPDYIHLDMRDAPRFTRALASIISGNR